MVAWWHRRSGNNGCGGRRAAVACMELAVRCEPLSAATLTAWPRVWRTRHGSVVVPYALILNPGRGMPAQLSFAGTAQGHEFRGWSYETAADPPQKCSQQITRQRMQKIPPVHGGICTSRKERWRSMQQASAPGRPHRGARVNASAPPAHRLHQRPQRCLHGMLCAVLQALRQGPRRPLPLVCASETTPETPARVHRLVLSC